MGLLGLLSLLSLRNNRTTDQPSYRTPFSPVHISIRFVSKTVPRTFSKLASDLK